MKWLDMYAKVAPDLVQSTARGGLFSLIAAGLMVWMLVVETWVFLGTGPVREKIDLELDLATELRMNVDLTFPNLACGDLTVELWRTTVRSQPRGMEKTLRVSAYNPASKRKKRYERIVGDDKASKSEGFTGCEVEGFINAYNSPGSLKISAPANANLSHTVNAFSFGLPLNRDQSRQLSKLSAKYRAVNEATLRDAAYHYHANDKVFHHFIHVVPTKYQLHSNKAFMAYQTLHQSHLSHHDEADADVDHWAVRFGFDISPMVARVTNKNATRWYDFITNLLAILGGAFTVVQLLERTTSVVF